MGIIETTTVEAVVAVNAEFRTLTTITTTTTMVTIIRGIITRGTMPQDRAIIITAIMAEGMRIARDMAVHSGENYTYPIQTEGPCPTQPRLEPR